MVEFFEFMMFFNFLLGSEESEPKDQGLTRESDQNLNANEKVGSNDSKLFSPMESSSY